MALRRRDKLALAFSPVFLRLAVGLTFLWAGAGKLFDERRLNPADVATLTSMGVTIPGQATPPAPVPTATPTPAATTPTSPAPTSNPPKTTTPGPSMSPPAVPIPEQPRGTQPKNRQSSPNKRESSPRQTTLAPKPLATASQIAMVEPAAPLLAPGLSLDDDTLLAAATTAARRAQAPAKPTTSAPSATPPASAPPPTPLAQGPPVRKLYDLALLLKKSSVPPNPNTMAIWPSWAAAGSWPVTFAWAAALGEFVCGAAILVGLFTRLSALSVVAIMLGAMWLTELGPAIQAGKTFLYLIPTREAGELFSIPVWQRWFWQLAMMCSAAALAMLGPGPLSLDHIVFGSGEGGSGDSGGKLRPKPEA